MGLYKGNASNKCSHFAFVSIFIIVSICPFRQSIVLLLLLHRSQQTEEVVTRGGIMEKKFVYFKLMQIVLTLAFIWQLRSLHQFCGTFADPKAFILDISVGHCKRFAFIGKDSKSGEFGAVFDHRKWNNQLSMSSTNGQPIEEQQHQFMDELATKLPPAGRFCIPITFSPFDWIDNQINLLNNGTLFFFSFQLFYALCSLFPLGIGTMTMLHFEEGVELPNYCFAFAAVIAWCSCAEFSSKLLLNWTDFWTCVNFQADHTNVPLVTLVISIIMVCSSVFEILFMNLLLKKHPVNASTTADAHHHKLRNDVATECAIV